jgi:hypothetical protein
MAIDAEDAEQALLSSSLASFPSKPLQALRELLAWPLLYSREAAILGLRVCSPLSLLYCCIKSGFFGYGFLIALVVFHGIHFPCLFLLCLLLSIPLMLESVFEVAERTPLVWTARNWQGILQIDGF